METKWIAHVNQEYWNTLLLEHSYASFKKISR